MRNIDLIIFDLDGTLVDSLGAIVEAVNFTLKKVGLKERSASEISSFIGKGVDWLLQQSIGQQQFKFAQTKAVFEQHRQSFTNHSPLYPGIKEMLEYFKNKRKVVVTNGKHAFALSTLETLEVIDCFENIIGGDDIECMKPSACPLDRTVDKFKVPKEKTMIVGDMDIDILAGKRAGIVTCGVTYGIGQAQDIVKAKPDYLIDSPEQLKQLIS